MVHQNGTTASIFGWGVQLIYACEKISIEQRYIFKEVFSPLKRLVCNTVDSLKNIWGRGVGNLASLNIKVEYVYLVGKTLCI